MNYHLLKRNNDMDIIISGPNKSLNSIEQSNETVNDIAEKHPIIDLVESFLDINKGK